MSLKEKLQSLRPDQWRKIIFTILLVAIAGYVLFRYVFISEQEKARRMVYKGMRAVEAQSVLRCTDLISATYADSSGLDKNTLVRAAARVFQDFQTVEADIHELIFEQLPRPIPGSDEEDLEATVRLRMSVVLGTTDGRMEIIDEDPSTGQFVVLGLIKRRGRWQLQRMDFININIMQRYSGALQ